MNLSSDHASLFLTVSFIIIAIELFVLGTSSPLLFLALGTAATSGLIYFNLISGLEIELLSSAIITALSAMLLWKPLKDFSKIKELKNTSSDMVGKSVVVAEELTKTSGKIRYSGSDWSAKIGADSKESSIAKDQMVVITSVSGTLIII
jgi:membrane protein implicated in regulation of membrane protease activity